jgi:hypothetical protein
MIPGYIIYTVVVYLVVDVDIAYTCKPDIVIGPPELE